MTHNQPDRPNRARRRTWHAIRADRRAAAAAAAAEAERHDARVRERLENFNLDGVTAAVHAAADHLPPGGPWDIEAARKALDGAPHSGANYLPGVVAAAEVARLRVPRVAAGLNSGDVRRAATLLAHNAAAHAAHDSVARRLSAEAMDSALAEAVRLGRAPQLAQALILTINETAAAEFARNDAVVERLRNVLASTHAAENEGEQPK